MKPIIYHANGKYYAGDAVTAFYENLKKEILSRPPPEEFPDNVLLLTYSNFKDKQDLEVICEHLNYPITVLGQTDSQWVTDHKFRDKQNENRWINLNKLIYLKDFADNHDFSGIDYVVILDDTDVVIDGCIYEAIRRFDEFGCEALFNAEVNCFSTDDFKGEQDRISADLGKRMMYLNSGCSIIKTGFLQTIVEACLEEPPTSTDDQIVFHRVYTQLYPKVKIDHDEVIFKALFNNLDEGSVQPSQRTKLAIGLPMLHPFIHYKFVNSYLGLQRPQGSTAISLVGSLTSLARNSIVKIALEKGFTHLLFLDTDMTFPPDTIKKLLSHNKDIVSGLYFERYAPYRPMLRKRMPDGDGYSLVDYTQGGLVECDALGAGCLLIKTEVFEKIGKPWFEYRLTQKGIKETFLSEDIVFCERAREAGFEIHCDTSIRCGHLISDYEITEANWDGSTEFRTQNWG
jgi:hypothetical protein